MQNSIYNTKAWTDKFIYEKPYDRYDQERVNRILESIPSDIAAVLDIGIGGGYIYHGLKKRNGLKAFGIDISFQLAKRLKQNLICVANVKQLPFKNKSFDLVLAADVIEHIKDEDFEQSVSEIIRVSRKYILIDCPYKDTVGWPVSLCNICKKEFNIYGHARSIDKKLIKDLISSKGLELIKMNIMGRRRDPRPSFLVYIARKWGKAYSNEAAICPYCFNASIVVPSGNIFERFLAKTIYIIFFLMDRLIPSFLKQGSEALVLLCKKNI